MFQTKYGGFFRIQIFFIAFLSTSLALFPIPASAQESQARIYFFHALKSKEEGRFTAAENLLRKAIELEPDNPDFHFELGNLYIQMENLVLARSELEQAVMIAPNHVATHYNLGLVYQDLGMTGEARHEFRRILELDPQNTKAMLQIGYTYEAEGFYDDARQAFEEARRMDFSDPEPASALEDLTGLEAQAQEKSQSDLQHSLLAGQQFLSQRGGGSSSLFPQMAGNPSGTQSTTQDALVQAGTLLIQQLLSKRKSS